SSTISAALSNSLLKSPHLHSKRSSSKEKFQKDLKIRKDFIDKKIKNVEKLKKKKLKEGNSNDVKDSKVDNDLKKFDEKKFNVNEQKIESITPKKFLDVKKVNKHNLKPTLTKTRNIPTSTVNSFLSSTKVSSTITTAPSTSTNLTFSLPTTTSVMGTTNLSSQNNSNSSEPLPASTIALTSTTYPALSLSAFILMILIPSLFLFLLCFGFRFYKNLKKYNTNLEEQFLNSKRKKVSYKTSFDNDAKNFRKNFRFSQVIEEEEDSEVEMITALPMPVYLSEIFKDWDNSLM
ncbi:hypothetical protein HK099_000922, partial [Clydaea vesicula]